MRRPNVTVSSARTATPRTRPLAPSMPLGMSMATTRACDAFTFATMAAKSPVTSRVRPAPTRPSMITSAVSRARSSARASGRCGSRHMRACTGCCSPVCIAAQSTSASCSRARAGRVRQRRHRHHCSQARQRQPRTRRAVPLPPRRQRPRSPRFPSTSRWRFPPRRSAGQPRPFRRRQEFNHALPFRAPGQLPNISADASIKAKLRAHEQGTRVGSRISQPWHASGMCRAPPTAPADGRSRAGQRGSNEEDRSHH